MKLARKIIVVGLVVVVLLVVGAFFWIDSIAKAGVETGGTYALGVDTTLDGMDVGVLSGGVEMSALNVANPTGFESPHFLHLGTGRVAVSLGSLTEDKVVVPEFTLSGLSLNLESKSGKEVMLVDGVRVVQAGVLRIMELQEAGWSYVRP